MTSHHEKRELLRLARSGHIRRLKQLLERDIVVNFLHHKTGMTPLMTAAHAGHADAVELLLQYKALPNLNADDNASALHWACLYGDLRIVNMLINAGADLNVRRATNRGDEGPAPIHMALRKPPNEAYNEVAITLIDAGARMDVEYLGKTVLQYAEWCECDSVASYLKQSGVRL